MKALLFSLMCLAAAFAAAPNPDPKFPYVHFACGLPAGTDSVTDAAGMVWQSDTTVLKHGESSLAWKVAYTVNETPPANPIYRNVRFGSSFAYSVAVDPGYYWVVLHILEPNQTAPGARLFTVTANGVPLLINVDLVGVVGTRKAYDVYTAVEINTGQLYLHFTSSLRTAVVSGFELLQTYHAESIVELLSRIQTGPGLTMDRSTSPPTLLLDTPAVAKPAVP